MNNKILFAEFGKFSSRPNFQICHEFSLTTGKCGHESALSSEEIIKAAGALYMHACGEEGLNLDYTVSVPVLSREEQNGLDLIHFLLGLAELVDKQRYEEGSRMLSECKKFSSQMGSPIERLCYYCFEALQDRIEWHTCSDPNKGKPIITDFSNNWRSDNGKSGIYSLGALCTRALPYAQILQFTTVQAILDGVGHGDRIHVIDLGILTGSQWTALIQSLALRFSSSSSSVKHLKITAVGVNSDELEESGKRLTEFAKAMAISFSYCSVKISRLDDIDEGLFKVKAGEFVAVNAPNVFRSLLYDPSLLGKTVNVIKNLIPDILVVSEVEAQHNSPSFADRFLEVLFYYSAHFDCLEAMLPDRNDLKRVNFEEVCYGSQIRNMIAYEGGYRRVRHVKMDKWRSFFQQAGFKEMDFSYRALYQAGLLLKQYDNAERFTIESNGSAITIGWKGAQLHTLSLWSFNKSHNG